MRLYAAVAASGFRRYATYRVATVAGVFTNTVFGFILAYTYIALWHERPHLGGYDVDDALTYVWLGQALLAAVATDGRRLPGGAAERIRTGDIAVDLYRPVDLQLVVAGRPTSAGRCSSCWRAAWRRWSSGRWCSTCGCPSTPLTWLRVPACRWSLAVVVGFAVRYPGRARRPSGCSTRGAVAARAGCWRCSSRGWSCR